MKRCVIFVFVAFALLSLFSCDALLGTPFEVTVALSGTQYSGAQNSDGSFSVLFPLVADISTLRATVPSAEIGSHGTYLGVTVPSINVVTNEEFYVTGARIENVRYRLTPVGGDPIGTTSDIAYVHPVYGEISPIFANLALGETDGTAVIAVQPDQDNYFDLGLSSALTFWDAMDVDRDNVLFADDTDEEITLTCSVFLEGCLTDGTQLADTFPPPLHLTILVAHGG